MGVDNGDDGEIDTGDDDDFTVVKIRMTTLTMKTVNGEEGIQRVEKKEDCYQNDNVKKRTGMQWRHLVVSDLPTNAE